MEKLFIALLPSSQKGDYVQVYKQCPPSPSLSLSPLPLLLSPSPSPPPPFPSPSSSLVQITYIVFNCRLLIKFSLKDLVRDHIWYQIYKSQAFYIKWHIACCLHIIYNSLSYSLNFSFYCLYLLIQCKDSDFRVPGLQVHPCPPAVHPELIFVQG